MAKSDDVHDVVERIQAKAQQILVNELNLDPMATMRFAMTLSEVCQNIVEHAQTTGWVAVQTYRYRQRLGRHTTCHVDAQWPRNRISVGVGLWHHRGAGAGAAERQPVHLGCDGQLHQLLRCRQGDSDLQRANTA